MLTNGTMSLEDGKRVSCVPSVPSHRSPEMTNQSGHSYQEQLQSAMLSKNQKGKRNRDAPSILVREYVPQ